MANKFSELFNTTSIKGLLMSTALAFAGLMGISTDAIAGKNSMSGRGNSSQQHVDVREASGNLDNDMTRNGAFDKAAEYAPLLESRAFHSRLDGIRRGLEGMMGITAGFEVQSGIAGIRPARYDGNMHAFQNLSRTLEHVSQIQAVERAFDLEPRRRQDSRYVEDENEYRIVQKKQATANFSQNSGMLRNAHMTLIAKGEAQNGKFQFHPLNANVAIYVQKRSGDLGYLTFDSRYNVVKVTDAGSMAQLDTMSDRIIRDELTNGNFRDRRHDNDRYRPN